MERTEGGVLARNAHVSRTVRSRHVAQQAKEFQVTKQVKGAIMTAIVALVLVALEFLLDTSTGIAGVFVMGLSGGLLLGNRMARA